MLTSLILGTLVGAVLGLTGAGGGILAVPALVVGMGWPMQQASPVALIAVAGSAAMGAVEAFRRGLVRYRAAVLMAITGVPVTSLGACLAHKLPQRLLIELFACVMLLVALRLFTQAMGQKTSDQTMARLCVGRVDPGTGRLSWTWATGAALAGTGALTGLMTGLLGVGGGFIIVPMLRRLTNVSMHGIVATSLMVVALVGSGGVISAIETGDAPPLALTLLFSLTTGLGMIVGRGASRHLSARHVQIGFAGVLVCVSLGMAAKAVFSA
jgi:uncharacterized membrane protein YfcA